MATTYVLDGAGRPVIEKDPNAILDYTVDWVDYLTDVTDTIASYQVLTTGVTVASTAQNTTKITAWLSGGIEGEKVQVTYRIVTTGGRTDDRSIYLKIKQR